MLMCIKPQITTEKNLGFVNVWTQEKCLVLVSGSDTVITVIIPINDIGLTVYRC